MPHIVIDDALHNFDQIKEEILGVQKESYRAKRGGPNGHSVKWFVDSEVPHTSEAIRGLVQRYKDKFNGGSNIALTSIVIEYQFIEYNTPSDQYDWHIDGVVSSDGGQSRRMTIALNLTTQDEDFEGGGFELSTVTGFLDNKNLTRVLEANCASALSHDETKILSRKNSVIIFNPDTIHRGAPIVSGLRQLLTVWVKW